MSKIENEIENNAQPEIANMLEQITASEGKKQAAVFNEIIDETEPGTIAILLESLPLEERYLCWKQVVADIRVDVLTQMRSDPRLDLLQQIPDDELNDIFLDLTPEELIEWSDSLPQKMVTNIVAQMGKKQREQFHLYNQYSDDEIGRYADHQMLTMKATSKVGIAQRYFRRVKLDCCDSLFVIDDDNCYLGTIDKYNLFHADTEISIQSILNEDIRPINANSSLIDAAEAIEHSNQTELPIINENNQLIGRLTLRTATVLVREHYEFQLMAQAGLDENDDLFAPILKGAKYRAVWLGINLFTAFLASATIGLFEDVLEKVVALAVLMPIVASMGGIAGSQTLTLMIRGLAMGQITQGNTFSFMKNELGIGFINGFLWALLVGVIAAYWFNNTVIGFTIGVAILINIVVAALSGVLIPMLLQKVNQDAALSGSVILTTVTDVVGFFTFLSLATLLILQ